MKLKVLIVILMLTAGFSANAQRGVRIGYIDTEYILENIPEYTEATGQLESKVQKWKTEIEASLKGIKQKRETLNNEKALLTKELIEEREEDIFFEEKEILDYQQKRFGPNGDLMIQKRQLMQPVQDQIFQAVQDIAKAKKYDFVFDKSADVVMLYSAERFDMSDLIIRTISRASKRTQAKNKAERRNAKDEDAVIEVNDAQEARQKILDDKKAEREAATAKRKQEILDAREAKKKAAAEKRAKILEDRAKAREEKLKERNGTNDSEETDEKTEDGID
ncbi:OmpH family outer membrane protein, partial [uncultured Olleya sp.]|uniref:OmpH family outer membrane protein n=1 Tax=uncultured Olleya sp. TaxID=757243 RepID=UPI0004AE57E4